MCIALCIGCHGPHMAYKAILNCITLLPLKSSFEHSNYNNTTNLIGSGLCPACKVYGPHMLAITNCFLDNSLTCIMHVLTKTAGTRST